MTGAVIIAGWYLVVSVVAFVAIALDKRAARLGRWRTPEARLHLLEFLGGFPGSFAARQLARHKTRKLGYRVIFTLAVMVHLAGWGGWWWLTR